MGLCKWVLGLGASTNAAFFQLQELFGLVSEGLLTSDWLAQFNPGSGWSAGLSCPELQALKLLAFQKMVIWDAFRASLHSKRNRKALATLED